jgi:hypothetical protein
MTTHTVSSDEAIRLGFALGSWLKHFHVWSNAPEQISLRASMKNSFLAPLKVMVNYGRLEPTIDMFPKLLEECREMFEKMNRKYTEELETGKGQLIHGDFWSGK